MVKLMRQAANGGQGETTMTPQANGIGNYTRTRTGRGRNPNGAGPSAEQMARVAAAGAESARRREAEQSARQQRADEEGPAN